MGNGYSTIIHANNPPKHLHNHHTPFLSIGWFQSLLCLIPRLKEYYRGEPYLPRDRNSIFKWFKVLLLSGSIGIVFALTAIVGYQFLKNRLSEGIPDQPTQHPVIAIASPAYGYEKSAGIPIIVKTSAFGPNPILSIELWIDGQMQGVHAGPPGGMDQFEPEFSWIPTEPGVYALVARAVDSENMTAASPSVLVRISPIEISGDAVTPDDLDVVVPVVCQGDLRSGPFQFWRGYPYL